MNKMTEVIIQFLVKRGINRNDIPRFLWTMGIMGCIFLASYFAREIMMYVSITLFAFVSIIIIVILYILAGITIFRPLIIIGTGLSVMSFLSAMYCNVPSEFRNADEELKILLFFGGLYLVSIFAKSLYKEIFGDKKSKKEGMLSFFKEKDKTHYILLAGYVLFIGIFLSSLVQVMSSIFLGQCIFQ